jgi:uncharacterized protein YbjT (DUF2867 family)
MKTVTVFGGTGFLGRHVVRRLNMEGIALRVAARHPQPARLEVSRREIPVQPVTADVRRPESLDAALEGAEGAVNAVSAYVEKGDVSYESVHLHGAAHVAAACAKHGVKALIHMSGIGADPSSPSRYISMRGRGEEAVRRAFPDAVILRPSVMFGPDDAFLNNLAAIARSSPAIPLIGNGATRLQPVHVEDVAAAVHRAIEDPGAAGKIFELAGPEALSLRAIIERILERTARQRLMLPISFPLARFLARVAETLPGAPLTLAQVELLEQDNVPSPGVPGLAELGISPHRLDEAIEALASRGRA